MSSQFRDALVELDEDLCDVRLAPASTIRALGRRRQRQGASGLVVAGIAAAGLASVPVMHWTESPPPPQPAQPASGGCSSDVPPSHLGATAIVFFWTNATQAQEDAVQAAAQVLPVTTSVDRQSRAEAFARFKIAACAEPKLVAATRPENMPESLGVTTRRKADYLAVEAALMHMPGVEKVLPGN